MNPKSMILLDKRILDYATDIERVELKDEYWANFDCMNATATVNYELRRSGFQIMLDVTVTNHTERPWRLQSNCPLTQQDQEFWAALKNKAFDLAEEEMRLHDDEVRQNLIALHDNIVG